MGECGSLGHSGADTLAQICPILIEENHILHLTVHSEKQTNCILGVRKRMQCFCDVPQSSRRERRSKHIQVVTLLKRRCVCVALHVSVAEDVKVLYPLTAHIGFPFIFIVMLMSCPPLSVSGNKSVYFVKPLSSQPVKEPRS